ncbi:Mitochondrial carnitine/acylcarnitine carrier protein [Liparis tanakae]|uniref:Mitochondrial carnitine/acylcarnitine carrier protein n=1 Tax=Liparis tanakae TaxID=230148 RepID=A0A4Z2F3E6_9TELE|nr:Mitochondrial carnitine/acylcarnitine carrier protein [Liparis tanakae]
MPDEERVSPLKNFVAGGVAGACLLLAGHPLDTIKVLKHTRLNGKYSGVVDVLRTLLSEEGPKSLYKGFNAVFLRAFPANAACFLGFEVALKGLNWLAPSW